MSTINIEGNSLNPDTYLELFDFDASILGGQIYHYTNTPTGGSSSPILWRNNNYYPMPFELTGVEYRGDGSALARPQIAISAINQVMLAAIRSVGDLLGMKVIRWRTYYKFTDRGSEPNSNMYYPLDEWVVIKKVAANKNGIQFEMANVLDRPGLRLPREQILKDFGFPGVSDVRLR